MAVISCVQQLAVWDLCVVVTACPIYSNTTVFLCTRSRCPFYVVVFFQSTCVTALMNLIAYSVLWTFCTLRRKVGGGSVKRYPREYQHPDYTKRILHRRWSMLLTWTLSGFNVVADQWKCLLSPAKSTTLQCLVNQSDLRAPFQMFHLMACSLWALRTSGFWFLLAMISAREAPVMALWNFTARRVRFFVTSSC